VSGPTASGQPLWHGRFGEGPADELLAFTVSLPFDQRLAVDDLAGSRAHVSMLEQVGLLTAEERSVIHAALIGSAELATAFAPPTRTSTPHRTPSPRSGAPPSSTPVAAATTRSH
jgi:hypothetical protein